jgi:putative membrane-bound dehydrogenase-like protein
MLLNNAVLFLRLPAWALLCSGVVGVAVAAQQPLKIGNNAEAQPRTAAEEHASFTVPEGFSIELVASEDTGLPKPIAVVFDDAGRMWSMTATEYPRDRDHLVWTRPGQDRVVIVDRPHEPGPHQVRTFADGMVMPLGVLPYRNGAFVAQGPDMLFLDDLDSDGRADRRSVLLRGFGVQDSHTLPHQLEFVPGNWIVFSQGVLNSGTVVTTTGTRVNFDRTVVARMRPDGSELEVIGAGLNNIWSWAQGRDGRVFVDEANDLGYAIVPFERDTTYPSFRARLVHPDSPYHPPTTPNLNLGGTGFSGLALSDDRGGSFPDPWHNVLFVANPITRRINTVAFTRGGDGVYQFEPRPDLIATDDDFFRPVAVRFGPDGCLYVVDWYNSIISHNEVDRDHPARDKIRGRIWRVRHKAQTSRAIPNVAAAPTASLVRHLQSDSTWEMRAAWHQIVDRKARELTPDLVRLLRVRGTPDDVRIAAVWALEGLEYFDLPLWRELLASTNVDVRFEAVRALSTVRPPMPQVFTLLQELANEQSFRVRNEVLRYFRDAPEPLTAEELAWVQRWRTAPNPGATVTGWNRDYLAPGGPYERAFQNLLVQMVEEKGHRSPPAAVSSEWAGDLRTAPPKPPEERTRITERITRLTQVVNASPQADIAGGESLFRGTCGVCHSTSQSGSGFGPSLAGSRDRATNAILTAVLDPDRAVESVFRTFHVETKDGSVYDGFFGDETAEAIVIRLAGGTNQVVPKASIKEAGYVEGSSVMPTGLFDALTDEQVINLVRYVQSLR